jgi:hypothetical protein
MQESMCIGDFIDFSIVAQHYIMISRPDSSRFESSLECDLVPYFDPRHRDGLSTTTSVSISGNRSASSIGHPIARL